MSAKPALRGLEMAATDIARATHALEWLEISDDTDHAGCEATRTLVVLALHRASDDLDRHVADLLTIKRGAS